MKSLKNNKSKKRKKIISILIIIGILVLVSLVGGGVYYYQEQKADDEKQSLEDNKENLIQEKENLKNEIEDLKKEIEDLKVQKEEKTVDEYAGWQTYINNIYKYEIKYPSDCQVMPATDETNRVVIQGNIKDKGWPSLEIHHYDTPAYNPPEGTDVINWLNANWSGIYENIPDAPNTEIDGIQTVEIYTPQSPQAYSTKSLFFIKNNKLFNIYLNDADEEESSGLNIYEKIVKSFKFTE